MRYFLIFILVYMIPILAFAEVDDLLEVLIRGNIQSAGHHIQAVKQQLQDCSPSEFLPQFPSEQLPTIQLLIQLDRVSVQVLEQRTKCAMNELAQAVLNIRQWKKKIDQGGGEGERIRFEQLSVELRDQAKNLNEACQQWKLALSHALPSLQNESSRKMELDRDAELNRDLRRDSLVTVDISAPYGVVHSSDLTGISTAPPLPEVAQLITSLIEITRFLQRPSLLPPAPLTEVQRRERVVKCYACCGVSLCTVGLLIVGGLGTFFSGAIHM